MAGKRDKPVELSRWFERHWRSGRHAVLCGNAPSKPFLSAPPWMKSFSAECCAIVCQAMHRARRDWVAQDAAAG